MAENDLLDIKKRNAGWAETFGGAATNLATRERYAADKAEYATALVDQQQQQLLDRIGSDKTAQDLYFRSQQLKQKEQLQQAQMQHAEEMHGMNLRKIEAQTNAAAALEKSRTQAQILAHDTAARLAQDEHDFSTAVVDRQTSGLKPGSPEWRDFVIDRSAVYPGAAKLASTLLKNAGIELTPDQIIERQKVLRESAGPNATVSTTTGGKSTVVSRPEVAPKTQEDAKRLSHLESLRARFKPDSKGQYENKDVVDYLDGDIASLRAKLSDKPPQQQPAESTASVPATIDKNALAQKAINDPNASAEHKAAARRILGLQ